MSEHTYLIGELLRELPCGCHPRLESLGGPARFSGGCGTPVIAPEAIVCADCGAWYCSRACISRHFEKEPNEALESKDAELAEMRTALESAPHDRNCNGAFGRDPLYPCDCWKSRALNPQPAQPALPALARQMWPLLNRERGVLISRQVDGSITEEEARRLHDLQDFADRWVEAVAPRVEINPQPAQPGSEADQK